MHSINIQLPKAQNVNNFNKVFFAIKEYCEDAVDTPKADCFSIIAQKTGIEAQELLYYFDVLQELGLIKYTPQPPTLSLTIGGMLKKSLFRE